MNIGWIATIIVGVLIVKFATGFLLKLLGVACLIAGAMILMYQHAIWPFKEQTISIEWLERKYCSGETKDILKCNCIVQKIKGDLNSRFTADELNVIHDNRVKAAYVLRKSYQAKLEEIKICLGTNAEIQLKEFNNALWHQDKKSLKKTGDWFSEKSDHLKQTISDLSGEKKSLDNKYEE